MDKPCKDEAGHQHATRSGSIPMNHPSRQTCGCRDRGKESGTWLLRGTGVLLRVLKMFWNQGLRLHDLESILSSADSYSLIQSTLWNMNSISTIKWKAKPFTRQKFWQDIHSHPLNSAGVNYTGPLIGRVCLILTAQCSEWNSSSLWFS